MMTAAQAPTILVVAEIQNCEVAPVTMELLSLGRHLVERTAGKVAAVILDAHAEHVRTRLISAGADQVLFQSESASYEPDVWTSTIARLITDRVFGVVLLAQSNIGSDLAPRLAFRLSGSVATNCENAEFKDGELLATRVCYGGKARGVLRLRASPAILTIRASSIQPPEPDEVRTGELVPISLEIDTARSRVLDREEHKATGPKLETAKIVIAGGRGLGGSEGFRMLEAVAEKLGAVVGASRVACDLGWCSPSMQIGLTGKTIAPELYIAVGISGASQHMAGCIGAKTIVAINNDPDAPIFADANIGVIGDFKELLPKIADEIRRLNS
jgi:electron transfer flavoprotein alpha subunit